MQINSKLNYHPKSKTTILFLFLLLLFGSSCKKNTIENEQLEAKKTNVLSKSSPDYERRLEAIKETFYAKKLYEKLKGKVTNNLSWEPNWNNPSVQVVSDTVSYVFYPLIGNLLREGKKLTAEELGSKSYLVVKNEKDFYYGMYYLPVDPSASAPNNPPGKIEMKNFTGNLLLRNLEKTESFIIEYKNGFVSEAYNKKGAEILKKVGANRALLSSIQTICHTEMSYCVYMPDSYACNGSLGVVTVVNCNMNPNWCGATWYLVDHSEQQVCENVWFPDPPTGPEENGGNGGGDGSGENANQEDPHSTYEVSTSSPGINLEKKLDCFKSIPNVGAIYSAKINADLTANDNPKALMDADGTGHAFITLTKTNGSKSVTESFGFYPRNGLKSGFSIHGFATPVESQINNDGEHEYNAYIILPNMKQADFNAMISTAVTLSKTMKYDINDYNCTNYILQVFNEGLKPSEKIIVPDWIGPGSGANFGKTPNGLYKKIVELSNAKNPNAHVVTGNAPTSTFCDNIKEPIKNKNERQNHLYIDWPIYNFDFKY